MVAISNILQIERCKICGKPERVTLFLSVPMDSSAVFVEMSNEELFHRHLHGGHTHLYTEQSLKHLATEFGFSVVAEWWFGADIVDWYRKSLVRWLKLVTNICEMTSIVFSSID